MRSIFISFAFGILLTGCIKTEGTIKISGKVTDEFTKHQIPFREIIVQGLLVSNNKLEPVDAGHFSTDSSGCFIYLLKKIKDARYYNFCIVGDSDYASTIKQITLFELEENAKYLSFPLEKLVSLKIKIQKISETTAIDTLYLSWRSNEIDFRSLYPYEIDNSGMIDNSIGLVPGIGLRWIGLNINSTVKTKVFANKLTKIHWELVRNKKRREIDDTIRCQRDLAHNVYFKY